MFVPLSSRTRKRERGYLFSEESQRTRTQSPSVVRWRREISTNNRICVSFCEVDIGDSSTQARLAFCDLAEVIWMPYPLTCVEKTHLCERRAHGCWSAL